MAITSAGVVWAWRSGKRHRGAEARDFASPEKVGTPRHGDAEIGGENANFTIFDGLLLS